VAAFYHTYTRLKSRAFARGFPRVWKGEMQQTTSHLIVCFPFFLRLMLEEFSRDTESKVMLASVRNGLYHNHRLQKNKEA
jgi:hypothetical protein